MRIMYLVRTLHKNIDVKCVVKNKTKIDDLKQSQPRDPDRFEKNKENQFPNLLSICPFLAYLACGLPLHQFVSNNNFIVCAYIKLYISTCECYLCVSLYVCLRQAMYAKIVVSSVFDISSAYVSVSSCGLGVFQTHYEV